MKKDKQESIENARNKKKNINYNKYKLKHFPLGSVSQMFIYFIYVFQRIKSSHIPSIRNKFVVKTIQNSHNKDMVKDIKLILARIKQWSQY